MSTGIIIAIVAVVVIVLIAAFLFSRSGTMRVGGGT